MNVVKFLSQFPGAASDARQISSVVTMAQSKSVSAASGSFSGEDVGKNIVIPGAGAGGKKLCTTITGFVDSAAVTVALAASVGQTADAATLGTDCSGALQAALDELASDGGGTLLIDGEYLLMGAVAKNFLNQASSVQLLGHGSASALFIACGPTQSAIMLGNLLTAEVRGIDFVGTPGERNDAGTVLDLQSCLGGAVEGNRFYGLSNLDGTDRAIVHNEAGVLNLVRNYFGGCIVANGGVVNNRQWQRFDSRGNRFIDFGNRNGAMHSKTPLAAGSAWIKVGDPIAFTAYEPHDPTPFAHAFVSIDGDLYDEGTKNPVLIKPATLQIAGARIAGCRFNVNGWITGTTGPAVLNTHDVTIEHCSIGYTDQDRFAIYLNTVRHARIVGVAANAFVRTVKVYTVNWLEIINSPSLDDLSLANVGKVTIDGVVSS